MIRFEAKTLFRFYLCEMNCNHIVYTVIETKDVSAQSEGNIFLFSTQESLTQRLTDSKLLEQFQVAFTPRVADTTFTVVLP